MSSSTHGSLQEIAIGDYLDVLRRRRWVILQTFAVVACIGAIATLLSAPVYRASAKLQVEATTTQVNMVNADNPLVALLSMSQPPSVQTQMQVLQSRPFIKEVFRKAHVGRSRPSVTVANIPDTRVIEVTCEAATPELAAAVPNLMLEGHVRNTDLLSGKGVVDAREFVEQEARQAKQTLTETEKRLIQFRQKNGMVGSSEQETILGEIARLEATLRDTGNRMAVLKGQRAAIQTTLAILPPEQINRVTVRNPRLDDLRTRIADLESTRAATVLEFKPAHPKVAALDVQLDRLKARLAAEPAEKVTVTRSSNSAFLTKRMQLDSNYQDLEGMRAQYRRQFAQLADRRVAYLQQGTQAVELAELDRVRNSAAKSYELLSDKLQDLRIREKARRSMARVIEPAGVPNSPVRPRKALNLLLACMVGLCLGVSMAFLQEFMDDRINSPEDVERLIALPVLGHIPTFASAEERLITQLASHSPITESYRGLRTSISFSALDEPIRTLLISSAHQGEGKSHTAVNLAIAMAFEGRRVILVDTDLRRPNVHCLLEVPQSPGLSEVLIGQKTLVEALQPTSVEGLQVVASGALPPNPAELLNSAAMQRLIEVLRGEADVVIFDTPPCIPVTDATVLSARVDGVLLVIRMGEARKAAVKLAHSYFGQARARILGLVLNRIDHAGGSGYYYDYRRSYYTESDTAQHLNGATPKALARNERVQAGYRDED